MRMKSKLITGADIKPGMDVESLESSKAFYEVQVKPTDDGLLILHSAHGDSCVIGADSKFWVLS